MSGKKYIPFVPSETSMSEFTIRALIIGLLLSVILGATNAYLGLKAGMTIAATYPAAVIGLAILKIFKGSLLEENMARTIGSIGEALAAGSIFIIPAFYIAGLWVPFYTTTNYITATLILIAGGTLGVLFVSLLRRILVEDQELPFPESVAAAEIHKAGRSSKGGSKFLFKALGIGALIKLLGEMKLFAAGWEKFIHFSKQTITGTNFSGQGGMLLGSPAISPAYMGVGYIIGPKLASLNFSGGILAWGLLVPIILYFIAPTLNIEAMASALMAADPSLSPAGAVEKVWSLQSYSIWRYIVRPIAIGGMLVGAVYTLFRMRKSLTAGLGRSIGDLKNAASQQNVTPRTEKDLNLKWILFGTGLVAILTFLIIYYIFNASVLVAFMASTLMLLLAFFFAAISGYLVGIIGNSSNPVSGLTLTALLVTALLLVALGVQGREGVATVLGVAAIICVSAAVAGDMVQDLKAGHILGGTPWKMELGEIVGVIIASLVMFGVLVFLNEGDIVKGAREGYEGGFGSKNLSAPQASLMAILSKGIVEGAMAWPLIIAGVLLGLSFILMQVKSLMLVFVGMYLPLETTFAIFLGGLVKSFIDYYTHKNKYSEPQLVRIENVGILTASGLIAGEALMGLVIAIFAVGNTFIYDWFTFFHHPSFGISLVVIFLIALVLIYLPLKNAGGIDEPKSEKPESLKV